MRAISAVPSSFCWGFVTLLLSLSVTGLFHIDVLLSACSALVFARSLAPRQYGERCKLADGNTHQLRRGTQPRFARGNTGGDACLPANPGAGSDTYMPHG